MPRLPQRLAALAPAFALVSALAAPAPGRGVAWNAYDLLIETGAAESRSGDALAVGDFNGDGIEDLAVGRPRYGANEGRVAIRLGSAAGLGPRASITGPKGFGAALAAGDFDGDGLDELAVGAPEAAVSDLPGAGLVRIHRRDADGTWQLVQTLTQTGGFLVVEEDDAFGAALAAGDFDADGVDDLAVGAPGESVYVAAGDYDHTGAGAVLVYPGYPGVGLVPSDALVLHKEVAGIEGAPILSDRFGTLFTVGDFDGDQRDDLAIGLPHETNQVNDRGAVYIVHGSPSGLDPADSLRLDIEDFGEPSIGWAYFGWALAAGNLLFEIGGRRDELVIGIPRQNAPGAISAGSIAIYRESPHFAETYVQMDFGALQEVDEGFGSALAVGDFDGFGGDDLAVATPGEETPGIASNGMVQVAFRVGGTLDFAGAIKLRPHVAWQVGPDHVDDDSTLFGERLVAGDFWGTGDHDLACGMPRWGVTDAEAGTFETGGVLVLSTFLFADDFELGDIGAWTP